MSDQQTFVVVGAGQAGAKAVEGIREAGFDGRVVLVGKEPELPYERPPLSKGLLAGQQQADEISIHPADWYAEAAVDLRLGVAIDSIDRVGHTLALSDGSELGYDRLLLATGAGPRKLDLPGTDLPGVHYLRRVGDATRLLAELRPGRRLVVVGAGWIGLEVAAAARGHDVEVSVIEPAPTPLHAVLGERVGQVFADLHRRHGVTLRTGEGVKAVQGEDRVTGVVTSTGDTVSADVVVIGVGAVPNTRLAERAGLTVSDGIVVDALLRSSDPDIFAAGDVARVQHALLGAAVRVEHWAVANDQGLAAGRSMAGSGHPWDVLPFFYTDQYDLGMEYHGWVGPDGFDEVVLRGDTTGLDFLAFWLGGGRVLAGMHVNRWDDSDTVKELARSRAAVPPEALADDSVPLDSLLG